jgi:hypothetical protein
LALEKLAQRSLRKAIMANAQSQGDRLAAKMTQREKQVAALFETFLFKRQKG